MKVWSRLGGKGVFEIEIAMVEFESTVEDTHLPSVVRSLELQYRSGYETCPSLRGLTISVSKSAKSLTVALSGGVVSEI